MTELVCDDCGRPYAPWATTNDLWNRALGSPDGDDPGGMLCPRCFMLKAEDAGIEPTSWLVGIDRLSTPPSVSAREIAERIIPNIVLAAFPDDRERLLTIRDAIASAIAPFEEQIRLQKIGMEQQAKIAKAQQELIDGHAEQIREKDREIERLTRLLDAHNKQPDWEALWAEQADRAEAAEALLEKAREGLATILRRSQSEEEILLPLGLQDQIDAILSEIETKEAAE